VNYQNPEGLFATNAYSQMVTMSGRLANPLYLIEIDAIAVVEE